MVIQLDYHVIHLMARLPNISRDTLNGHATGCITWDTLVRLLDVSRETLNDQATGCIT
jgi:hypothetical protein